MKGAMAPTIGQIATAAEVEARWAYAEMRSSRWCRHFEAGGYADLLEKARTGLSFCTLSAEEQIRLIRALRVAKTEPYINAVHQTSNMYECNAWAEHDLMSSWALPLFNIANPQVCIPYRDFYSSVVSPDPAVTLDDDDPRVAARTVSPEAQYRQSEPVIVIGGPGDYLLLEGYLRSILFMKSQDTSKRLLAWLPRPK
jgi:hypothetical protein